MALHGWFQVDLGCKDLKHGPHKHPTEGAADVSATWVYNFQGLEAGIVIFLPGDLGDSGPGGIPTPGVGRLRRSSITLEEELASEAQLGPPARERVATRSQARGQAGGGGRLEEGSTLGSTADAVVSRDGRHCGQARGQAGGGGRLEEGSTLGSIAAAAVSRDGRPCGQAREQAGGGGRLGEGSSSSSTAAAVRISGSFRLDSHLEGSSSGLAAAVQSSCRLGSHPQGAFSKGESSGTGRKRKSEQAVAQKREKDGQASGGLAEAPSSARCTRARVSGAPEPESGSAPSRDRRSGGARRSLYWGESDIERLSVWDSKNVMIAASRSLALVVLVIP